MKCWACEYLWTMVATQAIRGRVVIESGLLAGRGDSFADALGGASIERELAGHPRGGWIGRGRRGASRCPSGTHSPTPSRPARTPQPQVIADSPPPLHR